jgi:23S rRNA (cytidine1920-2'-O)/16S rRNA (cytidine1409-2'-O)-methyltransferase
MATEKRIRLDQLLVQRGYYATRSRARDAIIRQCVVVDGTIAVKSGALTHPSASIEIDDEAQNYVSRAALKLIHGLTRSGFDPQQKICLDIGASTGGFTQVLLEKGAKRVYALDVGTGQLDTSIAKDIRVIELSGVNARELSIDHLNGERPEYLVSDVSFISLKLALPPALHMAQSGAKGIFLIKPQFEVGRENIGKGGIVCDMETGASAADNICRWLKEQDGWQVSELMESPIVGSDGNHEYIVAAEKIND